MTDLPALRGALLRLFLLLEDPTPEALALARAQLLAIVGEMDC